MLMRSWFRLAALLLCCVANTQDPALAEAEQDRPGNGIPCAAAANQKWLMPPWCGSFQPFEPYDAKPGRVSASDISVAVLPRPLRIANTTQRDCPHQQAGLMRWNRNWLGFDGIAQVPPGTRALVRGNDDIPAGALIRS